MRIEARPVAAIETTGIFDFILGKLFAIVATVLFYMKLLGY